jgi:hypothetical protein
VSRFLFSHDEGEGGWIVLVFEDVEGRNPEKLLVYVSPQPFQSRRRSEPGG